MRAQARGIIKGARNKVPDIEIEGERRALVRWTINSSDGVVCMKPDRDSVWRHVTNVRWGESDLKGTPLRVAKALGDAAGSILLVVIHVALSMGDTHWKSHGSLVATLAGNAVGTGSPTCAPCTVIGVTQIA